MEPDCFNRAREEAWPLPFLPIDPRGDSALDFDGVANRAGSQDQLPLP